MKTHRRGVLVFLLLAFGLAWGAVLVAHMVLDLSMADPRTQLTVALPMAFAPAVAAVVVRRWVTREGFGDAGLALRLRTARHYYLLAWLGPVLVLAATVGLAVALGLYKPDLSVLPVIVPGLPAGLATLPILLVPVLLMPLFWGEELGWRSYLQQRVSRRPVHAAFVTGLIWAVWHYPLAFTDYAEYSHVLLGLGTWTLSLVAQAVILAWLFLRSGSIWVACLAHAGNNLILGTCATILLEEDGGLDPATVALLELATLAVIASWILLTRRLVAPQPTGSVTRSSDGPRTTVRAHGRSGISR